MQYIPFVAILCAAACGETGPAGEPGPPGEPGAPGMRGADGPPGRGHVWVGADGTVVEGSFLMQGFDGEPQMGIVDGNGRYWRASRNYVVSAMVEINQPRRFYASTDCSGLAHFDLMDFPHPRITFKLDALPGTKAIADDEVGITLLARSQRSSGAAGTCSMIQATLTGMATLRTLEALPDLQPPSLDSYMRPLRPQLTN